MHKPCTKCGSDRWRTVQKNKKYKCRKCGYVKAVKAKKSEEKAETV